MTKLGSAGPLTQAELFAAASIGVVAGLRYQTDFLTTAEEIALLDVIATLPLQQAEYKQWRANRRTISYGGKYDFTANELLPAAPIATFRLDLRERIAIWCGIAPTEFDHALIAEYRTGTQLGWHRDVHKFGSVVGVSLAGPARMRFRPYPPLVGRRKTTFALDLEPRSVYCMQGAARWDWQHTISATKTLRYSITFRTLTPIRD
ncbi:MAG TPA: alpha-ketoglutarate-dependent dioxygenase AlkB [Steroidobacteraceae bacterium]